MYATPRLTRRQPATPEPLCGTNNPTTNQPCGQPATWHILWAPPGPDGRTPASLTCHTHADEYASTHAWWARHRAGPACSSPDPTWHNTHCCTEEN